MDKNPGDHELAVAVEALQHVYAELHELAMSEDQTWDHRIRDLHGPSVYSYLLPDVQEVRVMARLLRLKIEHQLRQRDFEGALSAISDTVRLAEFVGQGETLIQKLVGIAIAAIVRDSDSGRHFNTRLSKSLLGTCDDSAATGEYQRIGICGN